MVKDKMGLYLVDAKGKCHELTIAGFEYDMNRAIVNLEVIGADPNILDGFLRATYHIDELPAEEGEESEAE